MSLELQIVLNFSQRKPKISAMKKTPSVLFHDNKPKSLNLILNFLLGDPFVSKICVISESLEKEILHG